jgi:hypothetical protein
VTYWVRVGLLKYENVFPEETVRWEPVKINMMNCQITDFTLVAVADVTYCIHQPVIYIDMTAFTEVN